MAETIRLVDYYYTMASDKAGEGARALATFKSAGVNLLAFSGFPEGKKSQLDFVPADSAAFAAAAKAAKLEVKGPKKVFVIEGEDRVGALEDVLSRLARAGINVTAVDAVIGGAGRWGALLWVKPADVKKAAQALGVAA